MKPIKKTSHAIGRLSICLMLAACACAGDTAGDKSANRFIDAAIAFLPGHRAPVPPPDNANIGPACGCGIKDQTIGSRMTLSVDSASELKYSSAAVTQRIRDIEGRNTTPAGRRVPNEVIITFNENTASTVRRSIIKKFSAAGASFRSLLAGRMTARRDIFPRMTLIRLPSGEDLDRAIETLSRTPGVVRAQPNYRYSTLARIPDDYEFNNQWGLMNTGQIVNEQPGMIGSDINAAAAWETATDCSDAVVAVLDSGINYNHRDFNNNLWDGTNCVDASGNPLGGCLHGYDYVDNDIDPADLNSVGHGTHVAGIIGAAGNNITGVTGTCWRSRLMAVRVLDSSGSGTTESIVSGIYFAVLNGAKIINASWGSMYNDTALYDAIRFARDNGVILIAAAGNSGSDNEINPTYPASFDLENIISVAAIDQTGTLAQFSCYGQTSVDIAAPGVNILSSYPCQMVGSAEIFSSWVMKSQWRYEICQGIVSGSTGFYFGWFGILNMPYSSGIEYSPNLDSMAYGLYDLTIYNPDHVFMDINYKSYDIPDSNDSLEVVYNTSGGRPDRVLGPATFDEFPNMNS